MVRRYATAVALARKYNVRNDEVSHAIARLAYFTDIIGNDKMRGYVSRAKDANGSPLSYTNDMSLHSRPGLHRDPRPQRRGPPVPVPP